MRKTANASIRIAYCGMAAALCAVIMLLGGVIPVATYAVPMLCGLVLLPLLMEFGEKAAVATYAAVALLALLLGFDKEAAFFYVFLGYYPIVKWKMDRLPGKPMRMLAKLLFFSLSLGLMYGLLALLFPSLAAFAEFREMGVLLLILFALMMLLALMLYDRLLLPASLLYLNRIRPKLRFLKRN